MKLQILLLGAFLCLGASAQGQTTNQNAKTTQSANRVKQSASQAGQIIGCVDQQNGHYVLRDAHSDRLLTLQPTSSNADDSFAQFVGHEVQASGSESSGTLKVTSIGKIADMCGTR